MHTGGEGFLDVKVSPAKSCLPAEQAMLLTCRAEDSLQGRKYKNRSFPAQSFVLVHFIFPTVRARIPTLP